ncbi:uncharacterized protein SCHCODRAFT_060955, partial [Schizophyllum commune H4-8]
YFFTQIPHPMHKNSEMNAILSEGLTSIHSLPVAHEPWGISAGGEQDPHPSSRQDMTAGAVSDGGHAMQRGC